jgi:hypothetical protein
MNNKNTQLRRATLALAPIVVCTLASSALAQSTATVLRRSGALGAAATSTAVDPLTVEAFQNSAVRATQKHFPRISREHGLTPTVQKQAFGSPNQQALGRYAENLIIDDGSGWNPVKKPNAPQNDLWRYRNGKLEGMQVKLHKDYSFTTYLKDMRKDHLAEYFAVADDHVDPLRQDLLAKAKSMRAEGLIDEAVEIERHAGRVVKIGATHADLEKKFVMASMKGLCSSAAATAAVTAGAAFAIDLAMLGIETSGGTLSGTEIEDRIVDASIKAGASGAVAAVAVLCGASPVGWVVIVGGAAAYIVTDVGITAVRTAVQTPVVAQDAIPYILSGWRETSWP